ncbi:DUF4350 domain-containing protein [Cellulomonas sp. McL0617]|uniref:DUF4350 domain-containing protein n=1 Tax=Cellulomonas sp. McL0617 TaxID=3415675 RepID=UPI003CF05E92
MSATVVTTHAASVVGDGTTGRSRAASRWRRWRFPLGLLALACLVGLLAALPQPVTSTQSLAPDNPLPGGARAAAQILGDRGVDVRYVRRVSDVVRLAGPGSTVLVVGDELIDTPHTDALRATGADLVLVDASWAVGELTDSLGYGASSAGQPQTRTADCDDPDAGAAGTITASGRLQALDPSAVVCFPPSDGSAGSAGAYGVTTTDGQRISVLTDRAPLTNARLADEGNAALVLRMLGHNERLVWYIPSPADVNPGGSSRPKATDVVPPIVNVLALQLLLVAAVGALWRGRRLGRIVTEQLPVVVRAGETTRGRGRLYRRSRSFGHAAAALRAGATARSCARLGLPRSAAPQVVIDALARASGRPPQHIEALLYGPPPTDDHGLAQLARDLDHLESEVHRS